MNKSLLVTRPNHDYATNYLCFWSKYVIDEATEKHIPVYDLKGIKATKAKFDSFLKSRQPGFLFLNGHGNATTITGFNNEPLLKSDTVQKFAKDTIVYARSCDAGKILGVKLIESGTRVFIGYKRKFLCGWTPSKVTKPLTDTLAKLFLEPSNLVPTTLLKGHTAKKAHERSKSAMQKNFRRMISTAATDEERYAARWLYGNMKCQVLYGDQNAAL